MGDFIVRASKDGDSPYLIWSTVVDAPTYVFTDRVQIEQWLIDEWRFSHPQTDANGNWFTPAEAVSYPGDPTLPAARLARADETGTSAHGGGSYGWDDEEFIVMEGSPAEPANVWWYLPRARLADYARALLAEDEAAAMALLISRPIDQEAGQ